MKQNYRFQGSVGGNAVYTLPLSMNEVFVNTQAAVNGNGKFDSPFNNIDDAISFINAAGGTDYWKINLQGAIGSGTAFTIPEKTILECNNNKIERQVILSADAAIFNSYLVITPAFNAAAITINGSGAFINNSRIEMNGGVGGAWFYAVKANAGGYVQNLLFLSEDDTGADSRPAIYSNTSEDVYAKNVLSYLTETTGPNNDYLFAILSTGNIFAEGIGINNDRTRGLNKIFFVSGGGQVFIYSKNDAKNNFCDTSSFSGQLSSADETVQQALETLDGITVPNGLVIQENWNADTNTPTLPGTASEGQFWVVSVAGNTDLGGITDWEVGDWAVKTASGWIKVDNTDSVVSVAGKTGVVKLGLADMTNVDLTGLADGQILKYNSTSGNFEPAAESGGGGTILDQNKTVYVGKHGNDTNNGLSVDKALLTIDQAITNIGAAASGNEWSIIILDSGEYTLSANINAGNDINIQAGQAIINFGTGTSISVSDKLNLICRDLKCNIVSFNDDFKIIAKNIYHSLTSPVNAGGRIAVTASGVNGHIQADSWAVQVPSGQSAGLFIDQANCEIYVGCNYFQGATYCIETSADYAGNKVFAIIKNLSTITSSIVARNDAKIYLTTQFLNGNDLIADPGAEIIINADRMLPAIYTKIANIKNIVDDNMIFTQDFSLPEQTGQTDKYYYSGRHDGETNDINRRSSKANGMQYQEKPSPFPIPCDCVLFKAVVKLEGASVGQASAADQVTFYNDIVTVGRSSETKISDLDFEIDSNYNPVGNYSNPSNNHCNFIGSKNLNVNLSKGDFLGLEFITQNSDNSDVNTCMHSYITLFFKKKITPDTFTGRVTAGPASGISGGEYFEFSAGGTDYYVWFTIDGSGSDPALPGKTGIAVGNTSSSAPASILAGVIADAIRSNGAVPVTVNSAVIGLGLVTAMGLGNVGFDIKEVE